MTSIVKVTAHCGSDKEVVIKVVNDVQGTSHPHQTLQNRESTEVSVYDDWRVEVMERPKGD